MAKILVVDDEEAMRDVARIALELGGHDVHEAESGEAALHALRTAGPFDAVVCDVVMPEMSGLELCRRIRRDSALSHLAVVCLSGAQGEAERLQGLEAGADDYMGKPFSLQELWIRVNHLLLNRAGTAPAPNPLEQMTLEKLHASVRDRRLCGSLTMVAKNGGHATILFEDGRAVSSRFADPFKLYTVERIPMTDLMAYSFEATDVDGQIAFAVDVNRSIAA